MADTLLTGGMSENPTTATQYGPSEWFGPYATNYLDKQQALSGMGFTPYSGQLTAGTSGLQNQAFQGLANLTIPQGYQQASTAMQGYMPQVGDVQSYMNPYLQGVLDPQLREARRQADITNMQNRSKFAQAGAFGGGRQAIMESEGQRNLAQNLADITSKGYAGAYDTARAQRLAELGLGQAGATGLANIAGQQQSAGLQNLQQQLAAGQTQRDIEQQGLTADYGQYMREFNYPQEQLTNLGAAIKSIPAYTTFASNTYGTTPSGLQSAVGGATSIAELLKILGQV
jgi:hypothetical protein